MGETPIPPPLALPAAVGELDQGHGRGRERVVALAVAEIRGVGRDVDEGAERERPLREPGMRDLEALLVDGFALDPQEIQIDGARAPARLAGSDPPEIVLDGQRSV